MPRVTGTKNKKKKSDSGSDSDKEPKKKKPEKKTEKKVEKKIEVQDPDVCCECEIEINKKKDEYGYLCSKCLDLDNTNKYKDLYNVLQSINQEMVKLTDENSQLKDKLKRIEETKK